MISTLVKMVFGDTGWMQVPFRRAAVGAVHGIIWDGMGRMDPTIRYLTVGPAAGMASVRCLCHVEGPCKKSSLSVHFGPDDAGRATSKLPTPSNLSLRNMF